MQPTLTKSERPPQVFSGCGLGGVGLVGVEVLAGLGLTGRQARVYLAALKLGGGKVQAIAELSTVSRQEIYRLIDGLQEMGLMQKNITNPATYTATPIVEVASMLLQQKTTQLNILSEQMKQLTKKLCQNSRSTVASTNLKPCFGTVSEADRGKKYSQAITDAEQSIEIVTSWRRFKQLNIHFETQLQNALRKGIALRIVTEKPANHHLPKWIKPALSKYTNFKLKFLSTQPAAAVTIFDQTAVALAFSPNNSLLKGPDMWAATPSLTALCQAYFNSMWAQAKNCRSRQTSV